LPQRQSGPFFFEAKAHELIGQLNPSKLAAVVHLLEIMINDDEPVSDEDRRRLSRRASLEEVLSESGFKSADSPLTK
jgi:hypothetical protein